MDPPSEIDGRNTFTTASCSSLYRIEVSRFSALTLVDEVDDDGDGGQSCRGEGPTQSGLGGLGGLGGLHPSALAIGAGRGGGVRLGGLFPPEANHH